MSISKLKETGLVTCAHIKILKSVGNDYAKLVELEEKDGDGVIPHTDAEIDIVKLKSFFAKKGKITEKEFDTLHGELKAEKLVKADKGEPEESGITKTRDIIQAFKAEKVALDIKVK